MSTKRMIEQAVQSGLDAYKARSDELVTPLPQELEPLQKFKDAVKRLEHHQNVVPKALPLSKSVAVALVWPELPDSS